MDLKIGNFRASYLDFRPYADLESQTTDLLPHVQANYVRHAIHALLDIGREGSRGPDVFHLELPPTDYRPTVGVVPEIDYIALVRSWLGVSWQGKFLVASRKERSGAYTSTTALTNRFQKPALHEWMESHAEPLLRDVVVIDETSLAAPTIHETIRVARAERMTHGWSFHYHRQCNESGMHVCSPVCDAAAQQVLNVALNRFRSPRSFWDSACSTNRRHTLLDRIASPSSSFRFCLRCPKSLSPFTIRPPVTDNSSCFSVLPVAV